MEQQQSSDGSIATAIGVQHRFELFVNAVQDYAIFMLTPDGRVMSWNNGAQRIKGYSSHEIIGQHHSIFYTPEDIGAGKPETLLAAAKDTGRVEDNGWRVRRDGSRFWADVIVTAVRDAAGVLIGYVKVTRDMTEQRRLASLEAASATSAQIQHARENEKKRIARELHDDLGQRLTALKMSVVLYQSEIDRIVPESAKRALAPMEGIVQQIDEMTRAVRSIASDLRPPILDDLGLEPALEWMAADFTARYGVSVDCRVEVEDTRFSDIAATNLFRVVQEALTNVARHAKATQVTVTLFRAGDRCHLAVTDDGAGATISGTQKRNSFGLLGIRERVTQLGGQLALNTAPGQGFRIEADFPVSRMEVGGP